MSTIETMEIQGIRSFGPDTAEPVNFFKPLTLILGPNGTGKTTIIECLKYATVGIMPRGSKRPGASSVFVHDPKLANEGEIRGQIKLTMHNVNGTACTVERSMTAKAGKGKNVEMKYIDPVLTRDNQDGEILKSDRCNKEMIKALGVSQAVLENVIFCHQEDSNWPFSEGGVLSGKFDDIFAATRYTKVLDELKELKQRFESDIEDKKKELTSLEEHKKKAVELQAELKAQEAGQAASADKLSILKMKLEEIRKQLKEIDTRDKDILRLEKSKEKDVAKKEAAEETVKELRERMRGNIRQESTADLEKVLEEFPPKVDAMEDNLKAHEQEQKKLTARFDGNVDKDSQSKEIKELEGEAAVYTANIEKRDAKIRKISQLYELKGFEEYLAMGDSQYDDSQYQRFIQLLDEKLESLKAESEKQKKEFEEIEKQQQEKIDRLKENKIRLERGEEMKGEILEKETTIEKLRTKHEDNIVRLLGKIPDESDDNWQGHISTYISDQSEKVKQCSTALNSLGNQLATKKAEKESGAKDLEQKAGKLKELEAKIDRACGSQDLEEKLSEVKESLTQAQDEKRFLQGEGPVIKKYIQNLKENNPPCPLCQRRFEQDQEVKNLILRLEEQLRKVPAGIRKAEEEVKNFQKKYDDIIQLKPTEKDVTSLKDQDIPKLKEDLRKLDEEIESLYSDIQTKEGDHRKQEADLVTARSIQPDIKDMDRHRRELESKVDELQQEKLTSEGGLQQVTKVEERKATLSSENTDYERDDEKARTNLRSLENQIQELMKERESVSKNREEMKEKAWVDIEKMKNERKYVETLNTEVEKYLQSGKSERLKKLQGQQSELAQLEDINSKVEKLHTEISEQKIRQREVEDSLQLRNSEEEVREWDTQITEWEKQLDELNPTTLGNDWEKIRERETKVQQELDDKNRAQGKQEGRIEEVQKNLKLDTYRDADKKYSDKVIEIETTKIVNKDLQRYHKAMENAILMYHNSKMEEINRIIGEIWRNTYKYNDIDSIEIRSELAATDPIENKKRRKYNYRVVMIKNGIPVNMRDRCSAGQKVLASLIIRLALAETFCVNCGVLALDEPTTNLDQENIGNLADALVKIIKERSSQQHFQLVVITHSEVFVNFLGRELNVDEYVEVSKDSEGVSRLHMKRLEELQLYK